MAGAITEKTLSILYPSSQFPLKVPHSEIVMRQLNKFSSRPLPLPMSSRKKIHAKPAKKCLAAEDYAPLRHIWHRTFIYSSKNKHS